MRDQIIARLDDIKFVSDGFTNYFFEDATFNGQDFKDVDYKNLPDKDLLVFFEFTLKRVNTPSAAG